MTSLTLQITDAGRAALVNAANNGTLPLTVSEIGVTGTAFTAAADGSDTALPGELKRISTIAGSAVAADTIHISITDASTDTYSLLGFGLYFSDGTLFALYGQATSIIEKSAQALMLLAADAIFETIDVTSLTFGDTSFALPPATTDMAGAIELATEAEAEASTDTVRAMTPATSKGAVDARFGTGAPSTFVKTLLTVATAAAFRTLLAIKGAALYDTGSSNGLDADLLDGQHGSYYRAWANLTGVPTSFPPSAHTHAWVDITGAPDYATRWAAWSEVTAKPTTFPPTAHSHSWTDINNPPAQATRWAAWSEITSKPTTFPPDPHTQAISTITGLQDALDDKFPKTGGAIAGNISATNLSGTNTGDQNLSGLMPKTGGAFSGTISATNLSGTNTGDQDLAGYRLKTDGAFSVEITAPAFNSSASSRTVKHDIAPCRYGLAEFLQIPWVEYRYDKAISSDDRLRFGAIVEDVEPIAPELVIHRKGQVPTFEYDQFIPVIGRALQQYIAANDARITALERHIAALEQR